MQGMSIARKKQETIEKYITLGSRKQTFGHTMRRTNRSIPGGQKYQMTTKNRKFVILQADTIMDPAMGR